MRKILPLVWQLGQGYSKQMKQILLVMIRGYQLFLSPLLGNNCRFYPTCSHYAREAIEKHGALKGSWLAMRRIGRCNPWHEGGIDPVPDCTCQRNPEDSHKP